MDAPKHELLDLLIVGLNQQISATGGLVTLAEVAHWINYRIIKHNARAEQLAILSGEDDTHVDDEDRDDAASYTMEDELENQVDDSMDDPWDYYVEEVYPLGQEIDPDFLKPLIQQPDELGELGYVEANTKTGS